MLRETKRLTDAGTKWSAIVPRTSSLRPSGFSFTEVLFAVIVLGIGFIMVAAIFPVAISQSKSTVDETTAAQLSRGAQNIFNQISQLSESAGVIRRNGLVWTASGSLLPGTAASPTQDVVGANNPPFPPINGPGNPFLGRVVALGPANVLQFVSPKTAWDAIKNNLILQPDPRFAYMVFYSRDGERITQFDNQPAAMATKARKWSQFARIIVVAVQVRDRSVFDASDINGTKPNLQARQVRIGLTHNGISPGVDSCIIGTATNGPNANASSSAAEGAFIIVAEDHGTTTPATIGHLNGRIYRLAERHPEFDQPNAGTANPTGLCWSLDPAYGFPIDPGLDGVLGTADDISSLPLPPPNGGLSQPRLEAYIVGRAIVPGTVPAQYTGSAQDIAVFTSWIRVN